MPAIVLLTACVPRLGGLEPLETAAVAGNGGRFHCWIAAAPPAEDLIGGVDGMRLLRRTGDALDHLS
ncbi:MAG: hypothetical protein R2856_28970 [Caldilineaceae bacterium]